MTNQEITCGECSQQQTTKAAKTNSNLCISQLCREPLCIYCGCTENSPCAIPQPETPFPRLVPLNNYYCGWVSPGICSAPKCIELAYFAITPSQHARAAYHYRGLVLTTQQPFAVPPDNLDEAVYAAGLQQLHLSS